MAMRIAFCLSVSVLCHALYGQPVESSSPEVEQAFDAVLAEISAAQARFTEPPNPRDKEWVKRRLEHLYNVDQLARGAYVKPRPSAWSADEQKDYNRKLANRIMALDRANTAELRELLKIYRWFPISEFGEPVEKCAWVLVQHADRDVGFQQEVLEILSSLFPKGETSSNSFTNLWDRVAMNTGKPQRYGTQGKCHGPGNWVPYEIEDPANVDQRRASVGLSTMAEYVRRSVERKYCQ
jgi:hypothetical protein